MAMVKSDVMSGLDVPIWDIYTYLVNQYVQVPVPVRQHHGLYLWVITTPSFDLVTMSEGNFVKIKTTL